MDIFIVIIYMICIGIFTVYTLSILHLIYFVVKGKRMRNSSPAPLKATDELPIVTVQLPMFNELYVAEDIIDAAARFDYTKEKLEIQVLDDSTDETTKIAEQRVDYWKSRGIDIKYIHRVDREGFKAGALQAATPAAKGEFICLFDADFIPDPDYLLRILPWFDENVGFVQARWQHLNPEYSLLTKVQAISIDAFFLLEQKGRDVAGYFLRFNGSAGVWRKKSIEDAGGWSADTLSEDLDLAYRAQLKGWKAKYALDIECRAELPVTYADLKNQHYRWTKGKAEVNRKLLSRLASAKGLPFLKKLHGYFDLLNIWVGVAFFIAAFLSVPIVYFLKKNPEIQYILSYSSIAILHTFLLAYYIFYALRDRYKSTGKTLKELLLQFLPFSYVFMNISYHQLRAIVDTYLGRKTPFIRTPKYKANSKADTWTGKVYKPISIAKIDLKEYGIAAFFAGAVIFDFYHEVYGFVPFHLSFVISFLGTSIISIVEKQRSKAILTKEGDEVRLERPMSQQKESAA